MSMDTGTTQIIDGQESWTIATGAVSAAVTVNGGMIAPVTFTLHDGRGVRPYYVNPWKDEAGTRDGSIEPPVLRPLRGDFLCLPFGANNAAGSEDHLPHGESAWAAWNLAESYDDGLTLEMKYTACSGTVRRNIQIGTDAPWILSRHEITGFSGAYPLGMHAILHGGENGAIWTIQTKAFDFGMVDPEFIPPYADGEYTSLAPGAFFNDLREIPTRWKDPQTADCSQFPARRGFVDIIALFRRAESGIAWTVAINNEENYLWYSLKDASVLPATVLWMEDSGRYGAPWSGRNSCIGIEETCSFLSTGRAGSIRGNAVNRRGIPTTINLSKEDPTVVSTLQGVLPLENVDISVVDLVRDAGPSGNGWAFLLSDGRKLPLNAPVDSL